MSAFQVGQRVKVRPELPAGLYPGHEGVIEGIAGTSDFMGWEVLYKMTCPDGAPGVWFAEELLPLTDPRASEFIADMRRFANLSKVVA